jgi:hypothetical protein
VHPVRIVINLARVPGPVLMWVHAVTLLVGCPLLAGFNLAATTNPTASWAGFAAFAAVGAVMVWRTRNDWGVR